MLKQMLGRARVRLVYALAYGVTEVRERGFFAGGFWPPLPRLQEVPALAEMLDVLLPKLSFLSIGTNDLTQFLFAADRANPKLAERYDWLSPAILRFLKRVIDACHAHGTDVAVCGEMGGRCVGVW